MEERKSNLLRDDKLSDPSVGHKKAFHNFLGKASVCKKKGFFILKILRADSATFSSGIFPSLLHNFAQLLFLLQSLKVHIGMYK